VYCIFLVACTKLCFVVTYTLIHAFLTKQEHTKAADALKKAAKDVVVIKDGLEPEGPSLEEIISQWKANAKAVSECVIST